MSISAIVRPKAFPAPSFDLWAEGLMAEADLGG